ncbi:MAG: ATP-dependent helicase [Candidatus Aenigmatarchaeota archaeon]
MISYVNVKKFKPDEKVLSLLRPYVKEWFKRNFKELLLHQKFSVELIKRGENILVTAPTGSGKTLAAFLSILDELFYLGEKGKLEDMVYCVYISPLKALINDVNRNLLIPLQEIREIAKEEGIELPEVRAAVRTGDVPAHEKQKQLKLPPHIICTTPETISIVLSSIKFREKFRDVKWVVVDEIHEIANSKRGVHLSLSLERLQYFVGKNIVRIGLGATLEPLKEIARFLVGYDNGKERKCKIVDARFVKPLDIRVLSPVKNILYTPAEVTTNAMYKLLNNLIKQHRTTLVFTNTRSGTERVVHHLKQMFPETYTEDDIGAHHSSVSREIRLDLENKLKQGLLKTIISSTSLELGIDIGYIDLVIQLGSPKSISRCVQRIGRAGHKLHETSKGRIVCMDRDDLVETTVMVKKAYEYFLDKIQIPQNCLDVLAQHIMGMSLEQKWNVKDAFNLIKNSYCYRNLDFNSFLSVLEFLSGSYHSLEEQKVYGKIWFDQKNMMFGRRGKYARVIYSLNIGTIPDEVKIKVRTLDGKYIGSIEEGFLQRLLPGDVFVLAGKTYEFKKARQATALVVPVKEKRPTVPAWFSEMLPLSFELALKIQEFRGKMFELVKNKRKKEVIEWLLNNYYLDRWSANSIYEYFLWEYRFLKCLGAKRVPDEKTILVENYIDEKGNQNIIFHTLFGRRINDTISRALGYLITKKLKKSVGLTISDNGFVISIPSESFGSGWLDILTLKSRTKKMGFNRIEPKKIVKLLKSYELEKILRKALRQTELIKRRFRHCATRSLMILRNYKGYEIRVARQQFNADRLLRVCEKFEKFPVVEETYREVMQDFMDLEHAKKILKKIEMGKIKYEFLPESNAPSPFAHSLIVLGESDVVLMEDRKRLLLELHKKVMERVGETD